MFTECILCWVLYKYCTCKNIRSPQETSTVSTIVTVFLSERKLRHREINLSRVTKLTSVRAGFEPGQHDSQFYVSLAAKLQFNYRYFQVGKWTQWTGSCLSMMIIGDVLRIWAQIWQGPWPSFKVPSKIGSIWCVNKTVTTKVHEVAQGQSNKLLRYMALPRMSSVIYLACDTWENHLVYSSVKQGRW